MIMDRAPVKGKNEASVTDMDPNVNPNLYGGAKGYAAHLAHSPIPEEPIRFYGIEKGKKGSVTGKSQIQTFDKISKAREAILGEQLPLWSRLCDANTFTLLLICILIILLFVLYYYLISRMYDDDMAEQNDDYDQLYDTLLISTYRQFTTTTTAVDYDAYDDD